MCVFVGVLVPSEAKGTLDLELEAIVECLKQGWELNSGLQSSSCSYCWAISPAVIHFLPSFPEKKTWDPEGISVSCSESENWGRTYSLVLFIPAAIHSEGLSEYLEVEHAHTEQMGILLTAMKEVASSGNITSLPAGIEGAAAWERTRQCLSPLQPTAPRFPFHFPTRRPPLPSCILALIFEALEQILGDQTSGVHM